MAFLRGAGLFIFVFFSWLLTANSARATIATLSLSECEALGAGLAGRYVVVDPFSSGNGLTESVLNDLHGPGVIAVVTNPDIPKFFSATFNPASYGNVVLHYTPETAQRLADLFKALKVPAVLTGVDVGAVAAADLSQRMGLPGNPLKVAAAFVDKFDMVELVKEAGLHGVEQVTSNDIEVLVKWMNEHPQLRPLRVKPRWGAAGDGGRTIWQESELREHVRDFKAKAVGVNGLPVEWFVLQEFLDGDEYIVETMSVQGETHLLYVMKYRQSMVEGGGFTPYHTVELLDPAQDERAKVVSDYILQAIKYSGWHTGPVHSEVRLQVKNGVPSLIEFNPRMGGARLFEVAKRSTGLNEPKLAWLSVMDPVAFAKEIRQPRTFKPAHLLFGQAKMAGTLKSFAEIEAILRKELRSFQYLLPYKEGGTVIAGPTKNLTEALFGVMILHDDPAVVEADNAKVHELEAAGAFFVESH